VGIAEELVACEAGNDVEASGPRVREWSEQAHHSPGVGTSGFGAVPLVDPSVDAGLHVVGPQLGAESREPGEQRGVEDALAAERGVEDRVGAERGEAELDDDAKSRAASRRGCGAGGRAAVTSGAPVSGR
jgi:hypothetical protein